MRYFDMVEGDVFDHREIGFAWTAQSSFFVTGTCHETGPSNEDAVERRARQKAEASLFIMIVV